MTDDRSDDEQDGAGSVGNDSEEVLGDGLGDLFEDIAETVRHEARKRGWSPGEGPALPMTPEQELLQAVHNLPEAVQALLRHYGEALAATMSVAGHLQHLDGLIAALQDEAHRLQAKNVADFHESHRLH